MKKAYFIKDVSHKFKGNAATYRMAPPFEGHEYVVASGVDGSFRFGVRVHETMMFAADSNGDVQSYNDLAVVSDTTDHAELMTSIGYEIINEEVKA